MNNARHSVDFAKALRTAGCKATPPRIAILEACTISKVPLDAEGIYELVRDKKVDRSTVYRSLSVFLIKGIMRRVDLRKGSVCYEVASMHHHHHIVCNSCGVIEDFETCEMHKIAEKVLKKSSRFKKVSDHSLELFGVCVSCAGK